MNLFAFSSILICVTNLFIIFLVFLKGRSERINIIWSVFCVFILSWGIGGYKFSTTVNENEALFWWKVANIGAICIPITYYQFVYTFLDVKKNYQKSILVVSYILGIVYLSANFFLPKYFIGDLKLAFDQFFMTTFSYKNALYMVFYITFYWVLLLYSFFLLVMSYSKSSGVIQNQLKYFLIASLIGWVGGHGSFLSVIKPDIYPYTNFLIAVYPLLFTYAILRYRLLDIRLIFKRTMAYSLAAGFLMAAFVIIVLTLTNMFSSITHSDSLTVSIIAALLIALLFNPIRIQIQAFIDKLFYTINHFIKIAILIDKLSCIFLYILNFL